MVLALALTMGCSGQGGGNRDDSEIDADIIIHSDSHEDGFPGDFSFDPSSTEDVGDRSDAPILDPGWEDDAPSADQETCTLRKCVDYGTCSPLLVCGTCPSAPVEVCNGQDDDCDGFTDNDFTDFDQDGLADCIDPDDDGDGVPDDGDLSGVYGDTPCSATVTTDCDDNCRWTANATQEDDDQDGYGDACDGDWDGDGIPNDDDNCPWVPNGTQSDLDSDGSGDSCDCDADDDGFSNPNPGCPEPAPADNCPLDSNAGQNDLDGDGIGDPCDPDRDGDGIDDPNDCAPEDPTIYPGAPETCNGMDDDCDGQTDVPESGCDSGLLCLDGTCTECLDGNTADWDGCTGTLVTEFPVGTYAGDSQDGPSVATFSDGSFVVVWNSGCVNLSADPSCPEQGENGKEIHAQRFLSGSVAAFEAQQVNTFTSGNQVDPAVTAVSEDHFLVSWASENQDGSGSGVYGRIFWTDGTPFGGDFRVNGYTSGDQDRPAADGFPDGRFVVTWTSEAQGGTTEGTFARVFQADGAAAGDEILVNSETLAGSAFDSSSVATLSNDLFAVASVNWIEDRDIYARLFSDDGTPVSGEIQVNAYTTSVQSNPHVAASGDGGFYVAWQSFDGSEYDVYLREFLPDGTPSGDEVLLNEYAAGWQLHPAIAAFPGGGFISAWTGKGDNQDGSGSGIYARRFESMAVPSTEFAVNLFLQGNQEKPRVKTFPDGGFVIAWSSQAADLTSLYTVFVQVFHPDGSRLRPFDPDQDGYMNPVDQDDDGDGHPDGVDCEPWDSDSNPGADEVCDGKDNDCNGTVDDGMEAPEGIECPTQGVCQDLPDDAATICLHGSWTCDLSQVDGYQAAETTCDAKDNDCDGQTDEGLSFQNCFIQNEYGACTGWTECNDGVLQCVGEPPSVELCDGKDNDCNGLTDDKSATPFVLLLVDMSGSMEYGLDIEFSGNYGDDDTTSVPTCKIWNYGKSRFIRIIEMLTGTYSDYSCAIDDRTSPADREDLDFVVPHLVPSGTQGGDGLLDLAGAGVKFGFMTFDNRPGNGLSMEDGYSYGGESPVNYGVRHEYALMGAMVRPAVSEDPLEILSVNQKVQKRIMDTVPYGGTPIAPMLRDALHFFWNDPSQQPWDPAAQTGDPLWNCRKKSVVLLTDGCHNIGDGMDGYQSSVDYAGWLYEMGVEVHVISSPLPDTLDFYPNQIADSGGTVEAQFAITPDPFAGFVSLLLEKLIAD